MKPRLTLVRDTLTPDLKKKLRAARNPQPALRAMGTVFASLATRAFNEPSLRPVAWKPLKDETVKEKARRGLSEGVLKATGALMRSPRIVGITKTTVRVGTDRRYASFHQLGVKGSLPARPFFPVDKDGNLTEKASKLVQIAAKRALDRELGMR